MAEAVQTQRARGMRDLLPAEMDRLRLVEGAFARTCRAWGYREVRTPVIEPLYLFTAAGTLSPQALERVYSFLDWDGWSGERVVLRPDSTIPTARLYAERLDGGRVAKLFYRQNIFRFTDDGSPREEWQCGVELIGDTGVAGDVELVLLAIETLRDLGLEAPTVRLSHAGIVRAVLAATGLPPDGQAAAYDRLLDSDGTVVAEVESRLPQVDAPLRLLFEVEGAGSAYLANVRAAVGTSIPDLLPALDELAFVATALEARGIPPVVQAALARSFEYYSGTVVQIEIEGERVCAGGRYDDLIQVVAGHAVPASGFALYVSPLLALLPADAVTEDERVVLFRAEDGSPHALALAHEAAVRVREAGLTVETVDSGRRARVVTCSAGPRYSIDGNEASIASLSELLRALGVGR
jgi:histidyl-tRNA synthetase